MVAAPDELLVLESCHSVWFFDEPRGRFHRVLREGPGDAGVATPWQEYFGLELDEDSDAFTVLLNAEGTRRLRSWRHKERCELCDSEATVELDLSEIADHPES